MELPSYSKQLLQQLYALCKEEQFCDCTIFIGNVHFRAHKVVLAAASLLFKSLLDSTDTISIDASVVTPEEFALLLEMIYSGKLPLGKHNFTKAISVADSLQMFDVAVSCKNLLRDLISCSTQGQVVREVSSQAADSSGNRAEANNLPQSEKPGEGETDDILPRRVSPFPGAVEAEVEAGVSPPGHGFTVNHTWVQQDTMSSDSRSLQEDSGSRPDQPSHDEQGGCVEEELAESPEEKGVKDLESTDEGETLTARLLGRREELIQSVTQLSPIVEFLEAAEEGFLTDSEKRVVLDCCEDSSQREAVDNLLRKVDEEKTLKAESLVKLLGAVKASFPGLHLLLDNLVATATISDSKAKWSPEDYGAKLLRRYRENLVELLTDTQTLLQGISAAQSLAPAEREVMEQVVKREGGGFSSLVWAALEERTLSVSAVWQLLLALRELAPLNPLMEEIRKQPGAEFFFQAVATSESTAIEIILRHSKLISEAIQQRGDLEGLAPGEAGLTEAVKELLSISAQKESSEASLKAALSTAQEKSVPAIKICQLLCNVHESFPDLQPVMQELGHVGLLIEGNGEKPGIRKWKVNSESQVEALDKDEDKAGGAGAKEPTEPQEKASSKKSFVCKACDKTFHFYCRLKVHMKRCRVARGKQMQCKECSEVKSTKKELEKHQLEVHGVTGMAKKKKKRLPVACDICGREFAHASGMQYHKLTEHFDEKPFSCKECGAKFAANSTLKNHLRLHTGDRPFMCKHCLMTFMQASALAYHTKKKHAEGKMYACQYCHAVFAQSIELSRHVRTHTGDKPYVCRECGKGFRQANGLSIHLRTFHSIEDPYDCKKCRMSFATLQEHRKHIHEAHSREYHPCPTCAKVFSAPSLLERHVVTHVGGKPFSCDICDKAYQQLSGLWYHNRTHHPDVFAAQNHRSSKFSSLQCSSCDKTFSSTAAHRKHVKAEHTDVKLHECEMCKEQFPTLTLLQVHVKCRHSGSHPFCCLYCSASFRFPGALQNHVTSEHFKQMESTFTCELCGELFPSKGELEGHYSTEHPKVVFSQATTAQIVQVIQTSEQGAAEHIISFDDTQLTGSQVFVTLPESQASQTGSELMAVTMEDLFDDKVTLICEETK
ncbi:zinc finger and BTB domain-containing protein 40 isoform X3 [Athene cunicularia]|uniref:zinc finger and BTB domain-containing protein 40 isoform X3 n=1 Tax=Athene cunicularia TaxID=194338 RepID=UPI000EF66F2B|nr:zinc finger and BTB domain-containing protein 40 isoform X3 [Athene cunicularia]